MDQLLRRHFLHASGGAVAGLGGVMRSGQSKRGRRGQEPSFSISQRLGSTHVAPNYGFQNTNILNEGAQRLQNLGTDVIKVWFHRCDQKYPQKSIWPDFDSLVERAQHDYFQELFDRPFKTYFLSAYSHGNGPYGNHYFRDGITEPEYQEEVQQFEEFTRYLLEKYNGTDKEFVLQHWEGDWAILGSYDRSQEPTDTAVNGMIRWLNARQEGVVKARDSVDSTASVLHSAEVNLVQSAMKDGDRRVINAVLPDTSVDLVSYSAYETLFRGHIPSNPNGDHNTSLDPPNHLQLIKDTLSYINEHGPEPSEYVQEHLVDPSKNAFIGEYGVPEEGFSTRVQTRLSELMTRVGLDWGARWVIYWQLYDNEDTGYWLIRDDNSFTPTYEYFSSIFESTNQLRTPEYLRIDLKFDRLVDERALSCAEFVLSDAEYDRQIAFNIGTPQEEPILWRGTFWTHEDNGRTWRWFGGNDARTTIYLQRPDFDIDKLRIYGYPREAGIEATVSLNGEKRARKTFDEHRWRDWVIDVSTSESTPTDTFTTDTPRITPTATSTSQRTTDLRTIAEQESTPSRTESTTSVRTPGLGAISAGLGIATLIGELFRKGSSDDND